MPPPEHGEQLRAHYQPRLDLRTTTVVGYEALVRWQHPDRGLLGPAEFLPVAEDSGLIRELGGWVLREACRTAAGWHAADPDRRLLDIAVNLSAGQIADLHLTALVAGLLTETGLDPAILILEVTETAVDAADTAIVSSVISLGRAVGVQVLAEGVETREQHARLVSLDCCLAQGYLFAAPVPADQLPVADRHPRRRGSEPDRANG